jgi:hypothetical protein
MQKRFQVVETEGTTNRDSLRCVSCPKLTVRVAANGSKDCMEVKNYQHRSTLKNAYALHQSANCLGLRQRICFKNVSLGPSELRGKCKQEINSLTSYIIPCHASENRVRPGSRMVDDEEGSVRQFRHIPICGIIFSALALLFRVYLKQRINFTTLVRKRSLCSCAEI